MTKKEKEEIMEEIRGRFNFMEFQFMSLDSLLSEYVKEYRPPSEITVNEAQPNCVLCKWSTMNAITGSFCKAAGCRPLPGAYNTPECLALYLPEKDD
ncbi:MAG: hypothetical protein PQJ60_10750 [Spirochaetales bacterium]|nr:hypothetical protein [Spirochaetales bacterium]